MDFGILGWSFHKTPIELRDRLALSAEERGHLLEHLYNKYTATELVILSTCNRTEIYFRSPHPEVLSQQLLEAVTHYCQQPALAQSYYTHYNLDAVNHAFRVASSLDSMILGEAQILGQVKEAYEQALQLLPQGALFKSLFPRIFSVAKRIRTETQISNFAVSISFAAVELSKKIFQDLRDQTVMVVGAGEMAELAVKHFVKNGVSRLMVTNRTFAHALKLADTYQGTAVHFEQLSEHLSEADIIISSTGAKQPIITTEMVRNCIKKRKGDPMFLIDIAVPRDIDAEVNTLSNVYLYDIDDLQEVVDTNRKEREHAAEEGLQIISEELEKLGHWFKSLSVAPTIKHLREHFHNIGTLELEKTFSKLNELNSEQKEHISNLIYSTLNKILHKPSTNLKQLSHKDEAELHIKTLLDLFELSSEKQPHPVKRTKLHLISK